MYLNFPGDVEVQLCRVWGDIIQKNQVTWLSGQIMLIPKRLSAKNLVQEDQVRQNI